jgi:UDP-N-acetylglucosamine 2-epimerase
MYDALLQHAPLAAQRPSMLESLGVEPGRYCLATIHRQGNTDDPVVLTRLLQALNDLGEPVILPLHPRTEARMREATLQAGPNIRVIKPLGYLDMLQIERSARIILTDSGGVQKEAFLLSVPCVTLREETEWIETVETGWNQLAGSEPARIVAAARTAAAPRDRAFPYGDGHAADVIVECLIRQVG